LADLTDLLPWMLTEYIVVMAPRMAAWPGLLAISGV
jgi:hypothetical protein